jgi:hypothetical protein
MQWDYLNIMNTSQHMFWVKCFHNPKKREGWNSWGACTSIIVSWKVQLQITHLQNLSWQISCASHPLPIRHNKMAGSSHQLRLHTDQPIDCGPPFH